jgi:hypothetical protein
LTRHIAVALLFLHQLIKDTQGIFIIYGNVGFGAGVEGRSTPAIREIDDETFAGRFDGALIHFVTGAFAIIQGDVFEYWSFECLHFYFLLVVGSWLIWLLAMERSGFK